MPGDTKSRKIDELLGHIQRRGRLSDLIAILNDRRPHIKWPKLSEVDGEASGELDLITDSDDTLESVDANEKEDEHSLAGRHFWQAVEKDIGVPHLLTLLHDPAFAEGYSDFLSHQGYVPDPLLPDWWRKGM